MTTWLGKQNSLKSKFLRHDIYNRNNCLHLEMLQFNMYLHIGSLGPVVMSSETISSQGYHLYSSSKQMEHFSVLNRTVQQST